MARYNGAPQKADGLGYTGHLEDDDLELTYMQQRYYDPIIGRFYSNDPVGFTASNPMMFNRYAYANNNSYRLVDPDGRLPVCLVPGPMQVCAAAAVGAINIATLVTRGAILAVGGFELWNESGAESAKDKIIGLVGGNPSEEDLQNPCSGIVNLAT